MKNYYTVVASFPHLPYFEKGGRLPLTRLRLEQRLRMLEPDETQQVYQAENLTGWRYSAEKPGGGSSNFIPQLTKSMKSIEQPVLREFVTYRLEMQTVLAALRLRQVQRNVSQSAESWGFGRWVKHIEANWDSPDFRLGMVYPWLPEALNLLRASDVTGLERLLMCVVWGHLSRLADANPFGFEAITAFVFKWDISQAWLLRDAVAAKRRFQTMIEEVKHVQ